jgi:hypothetical protein
MKVVVGAALSVPPFSPGTAWDRLHYALGLKRLGHDVIFVEEVTPKACLDQRGRPCSYEESANRELFLAVMREFDLLANGCQLYDGGAATAGLDVPGLVRALDGADLLINISGHVKSALVLERVERRAYLDVDPVYTQVWHAVYGAQLHLDRHHVLFTIGLNIGTPASPVPDGGLSWKRCPPVVVPELWPVDDGACTRLTTVASWGRYADLEHDGRLYGSKRGEFRKLAALPERVGEAFEVALRECETNDPDAAALRRGGWRVIDGTRLRDLARYRDYIRGSRAEIGIAKGAYVEGRSGWASDRSCHYLASGKPVVAQSTGLEGSVPTGRGLVTFDDLDEAAESVAAVTADYRAHCRAARELAHDVFGYRVVLPSLLDTAMSASP